MVQIDYIVIEQCKIYIIYRNPYTGGLCIGRQIEFLDIFNFFKKQAGNALLQDIIYSLLEIGIQGEINIITGDRLHPSLRINFLAQVIHIYGFPALLTLQIGFHHLFNSGFPYGIIHFIPSLIITALTRFFIQALKLL